VGESLPLKINPFLLVDRGETISGKLPLASMKRLAGLLCSVDGDVDVQLHFGREAYGPRYIKGRLLATLLLTCQRCGEPVSYGVDLEPCLSPVVSDAQAAQLTDEYEPLVTGGEPVALVDVIEEELLLSLPMVPKHEQGECKVDFSKPIK